MGIDYNPRYSALARRRHRRTFIVVDITALLSRLEQRLVTPLGVLFGSSLLVVGRHQPGWGTLAHFVSELKLSSCSGCAGSRVGVTVKGLGVATAAEQGRTRARAKRGSVSSRLVADISFSVP